MNYSSIWEWKGNGETGEHWKCEENSVPHSTWVFGLCPFRAVMNSIALTQSPTYILVHKGTFFRVYTQEQNFWIKVLKFSVFLLGLFLEEEKHFSLDWILVLALAWVLSTTNTPPLSSLLQCHSGILGGGHYVTYAKNPNSKWYCYNDSSCKVNVPDLLQKKQKFNRWALGLPSLDSNICSITHLGQDTGHLPCEVGMVTIYLLELLWGVSEVKQ